MSEIAVTILGRRRRERCWESDSDGDQKSMSESQLETGRKTRETCGIYKACVV